MISAAINVVDMIKRRSQLICIAALHCFVTTFVLLEGLGTVGLADVNPEHREQFI